jgi:Ca2+-binding EF-hand superfamily protein
LREFVTLFGRRKKMTSKKRVMKLFQSVDLDGNGYLDYFEVRQLLLRVNLSEDQFSDLMKSFDKDNDG